MIFFVLQQLIPFIEAYSSADTSKVESAFLCLNRAEFAARNYRWFNNIKIKIGEEQAAKLLSIIGEIGNNCYDHNLGHWQNQPGLCFYNESGLVLIFDNGQGIQSSLTAGGHKFQNENDFLNAALTQRITGRAPENRGNGLKLVLKFVNELDIQFFTQSGSACYYTDLFDLPTVKYLKLKYNAGVISILDFRNLLK